MDEPEIIFRPLDKDAICPKRHSDGAAGYDLHSIFAGNVPPHSTVTINLGFSFKMPQNLIGYICGRSGFSLRNGINVQNSYVLDDKEVCLNLVNHSSEAFTFDKGTRIAQLFFAKIDEPIFGVKSSQND
jgi:dUTP pyrophosphatase